MKIKITRNVLLIGIVSGFLLYCIINDCSIKEGLSKKDKNPGFMGKITGAVSSAATATGTIATNTLKGGAKMAGQVTNVVKTSGKIFTNQANKKSSI